MSTEKVTKEWYISFGEERGMPGVRTWLSLYSRTFPNSPKKLTESWIGGSCDMVRQKQANKFRDLFKEVFNNVFTDEEKKEVWWNTDKDFEPYKCSTHDIYSPLLTSGAICRDKEEMEKIEKNLIEVFKKIFR